MERLRSLSLGWITALCTLVAVAVVAATYGQQMFSSGPLSAHQKNKTPLGGVSSHAEIGSNCAACHASPIGGSTMADRCLECHTDIRASLESKSSMHGLQADAKACTKCHTEHRGVQAKITSFTHFHHDHTAFPLTGKHGAVQCASCHADQQFKGTPRNCVSCHEDPKVHKGRYGTQCAHCHTTATWTAKTLDVTTFNHDLTSFRLTGKHPIVDCKACHVRDGKELYQGTPHDCKTCHQEPATHKPQQYGANCTMCHTTSDWHGFTFKHRFPLHHGNVGNGKDRKQERSCAVCHANQVNLADYTCYGCHHHTPQKEAARHANRKMTTELKNCVVCHRMGNRERGVAFQLDEPAPDQCERLAAITSGSQPDSAFVKTLERFRPISMRGCRNLPCGTTSV